MKCSEPGVHRITLDAKSLGSKTRDLKFRTTFMCYDWYLVAEHTEHKEGDEDPTAGSSKIVGTFFVQLINYQKSSGSTCPN